MKPALRVVAPARRDAPHDLEAEQCALGACLLSTAAREDVAAMLAEDDFSAGSHRRIWAALLGLHLAGGPVDPVTVGAALERAGELEDIGGPAYLHTLVEAVPTVASATAYAAIVAEHARLRAIGDLGARVSQIPLERGVDEAAMTAEAAAKLAELAVPRVGSDGLLNIEATLRAAEDGALTAADGALPLTGLRDLDDVLGAMRPGRVIVFAGRPGTGKSTLAIQTGMHTAERVGPVWFCSYEMSEGEIGRHLLAKSAGVSLGSLERVEGWTDWVRQVAETLKTQPFRVVVDLPNVAALGARLHQAKERPTLVIVDYLQLMPTAGEHENRTLEVASISRALKLLAMREQVAIIECSQVRRLESGNRKPTLADLRESGAIENDADQVVLLHPRGKDHPGITDAIVAKNRWGPADKDVPLVWVGKHVTFKDCELRPLGDEWGGKT